MSYNAPKLSSCATWDPVGITLGGGSVNITNPIGIFVRNDDTAYVAATGLTQLQMWLNGSNTPRMTFNISSSAPLDVFVINNGDIFVDNGNTQHRVDRWTLNGTSSTTAMYVGNGCYGLFVDTYDNLYCSTNAPHQVIKRSLYDPINSTAMVAGNGNDGSAPDMLSHPRGIFVDLNLQLFVADCYNDRVQRLPYSQQNGTTVAGNGATGTIVLNRPTDVILDADGYLFIVDFANHRVIGSGVNGFRCIVGCTGGWGSAPDQFNLPHSLSFDSGGNLFVTDSVNNRVQKFLLSTNSCGECITMLITITYSL